MADLLRGLDLVLVQGRRDEVIATRELINRILDADAFGGEVEDGE